MDEKEYRQLVDALYERFARAFDDVDPDVAEIEIAQGAATILLRDGSRCILSAQPSVRQVWLAAASRGLAFHFSFDAASGQWRDDKGRGVELVSYVRELVREAVGIELKA